LFERGIAADGGELVRIDAALALSAGVDAREVEEVVSSRIVFDTRTVFVAVPRSRRRCKWAWVADAATVAVADQTTLPGRRRSLCLCDQRFQGHALKMKPLRFGVV